MELNPIFFEHPAEFRKWLEGNHKTETEVFVGYYRISTKKQCMNWSESVDEAICFGWIDGIRRKIDEVSYCNRFTPRKAKSNWSAVNIKKVEELLKAGKMTSSGISAFEKRTEAKSAMYSYENKPEKLDSALESRFQENSTAWDFFNLQSQSYQKMMFYWVMSAKQETTRFSRLEKLIGSCERGERLR